MAPTKRICAFATCLTLAWAHIAYAYQQETHRKISEASANNSILAATTENVLTDFGLKPEIAQTSTQKFPNSSGELKTIIRLIEDGSDFEDNGIRSVQHFYDPINDRSLQHPLLTLAGGTNKSPDWAIEDTGSIAAQEYSYANAVEAFYQALTLPTKTERDGQWGRLFETLGHVIHHVQDMAQPEHVRNDLHCGEVIPCGIPGAVLGLYDQSLFESRSFEVFKDGIPANLINYPAVSFPTAREFWTTRDADGSVTARRGLADFTNRNFVSKDTNFELISGVVSANSKYSLPAPMVDPTNTYSLSQLLPSDGADICQTLNQNGPIDLPANAPCEIEFIKSTVTDSYAPAQGGTNLRAASLSLFDQYLDKYNVNNVSVQDGDAVHMVDVDRLLTINRLNVDAAHTFLIPRAVAYSAGLIDHFFRGRIDMVPNSNGEGWVIKNLTDEDMQGDFTLYYDHIQNVNGQDVTQRDPIPGASWPAMVVPANGEVIVGNYTIPTGLLSKTLVFSGLIGTENAVAGKHFGGWTGPFPVILPTSTDIYTNNDVGIAVDAGGNAMVTYYTYDSNTYTSSLWSHRYTSMGAWGDATLIKSSAGFDRPHSLAMDADGNAIVVYRTHDGLTPPSWLMWSRRYTPAGGWGGATMIDSHDNTFSFYVPSLDMDADGDAMLAYRTYEGSMRLWSRHYTPNGGWSGAALIDDDVAGGYFSPSLSVDAVGNAMVVYCTYDSATQLTSLLSRRYAPAGGWGDATVIGSQSDPYSNPYYARRRCDYAPSLSVDADGNAMVAYRTYDATALTYRLWTHRYTLAGGWNSASLIADVSNQRFFLSLDAAGKAIICYRNVSGSVVVRHYAPGVGWGEEIELAAPDQQNPEVYPVSMDTADNGNAVVLWKDRMGNLWSNHYTP